MRFVHSSFAALATICGFMVLSTPASADSPCSMTTASGTVINLSSVCAGKTTTPTPTQSIPRSSTKASTQGSSAEGYRVSEGQGGYANSRTGASQYFYYEVWSNLSNTIYTLKVWNATDYPSSSPFNERRFRSAREALDYFDCYYARRSIPSCKQG